MAPARSGTSQTYSLMDGFMPFTPLSDCPRPGGNRMVPLSALIGAKRDLKALRKEVEYVLQSFEVK